MSNMLTKNHGNERDKNVPPIVDKYENAVDENVPLIVDKYVHMRGDKYLDRRGFLTPPEEFSDEYKFIKGEEPCD